MKRLGELLGSAGRVEILRVLMAQKGAIGLRQAARIAGIHPHSAEVSLAGLMREGLVRRCMVSGRPGYEMVREREEVVVLEAIFPAAEQGYIKVRQQMVESRAKQILPFISTAAAMLRRARGNQHVA